MNDYSFVDYKDIEKITEIKFSNPMYTRKVKRGIKEKFYIFLCTFYKKHRAFLSKIWKESDELKSYLDLKRIEYKDDSNAASIQYNQRACCSEQPFFYLERIHFAEVLPKGQVEKFESDLRSFVDRNRRESIFSIDNGENLDFFEMVCKSRFEQLLASFAIDKKTSLGKVFDDCRISAESMSDSFIKIVFDFGLNERYKEAISRVFVGNIEKYKTFFSMKRVRFRSLRFMTKGYYSEHAYKKCIIDSLINEVKFCARREVVKGLGVMNYPGESNEYKAFLFFETNVDKNSDRKFWESIGVDKDRCFFSDMSDACIYYSLNNSADIFCIYKKNNKYKYPDIFKGDAANCFNNILAYSHVQQNCIFSLTIINKWMQKCKKDSLSIWMTLYSKADKALELVEKFYEEYSFKEGCVQSMWRFESLSEEKITFDDYDSFITNEIHNNQKNIRLIKKAISEKMSMKNTIVSMGMQKLSVVIGLTSAIISFFAIFLTLTGENVNTALFNSNKDVIINVFAFVMSVVIIYYIFKIIAFFREMVLKIIRFI
nr:hypothetical protein [uncultured Butyrivibrio sp.]